MWCVRYILLSHWPRVDPFFMILWLLWEIGHQPTYPDLSSTSAFHLILDWWTSRCFYLCLLVYLTLKSHFLSLYLFFNHSWILIPCITLESYFSTILSCTFLHLFELSFKYIQIYVYLVNLYLFLHLHWFTVWTQDKK